MAVKAKKSIIIYATASAIGKSSGLILIPLYALALTLDQIGAWAQLSAIRIIGTTAFAFALDGFITQRFHKIPESGRIAFVDACLRRCAVVNAPIAMISAVVMATIPALATEMATVWSAQGAAVSALVLNMYRLSERPMAYAVASTLLGLSTVILCWLLVLWFHLGLWGLIVGLGAPPCIFALWRLLQSRVGLMPDDASEYMCRMLPGRILGESAGQVDRIVLGIAVSDASLGLYDLALRYAGATGLLANSMKALLVPRSLRLMSEGISNSRVEQSVLRSFIACSTVAGATLVGGAMLALFYPDASWTPALALLPGALLFQLWSFAQLGPAVNIVHFELNRLQWWTQVAALVVGGSGCLIGALLADVRGAQAGLICAVILVTLPLPLIIARQHPTAPRHRLLFAFALLSVAIYAFSWTGPRVMLIAGLIWSAVAAAATLKPQLRT